MRRVALPLCLVALLVGCGEKAETNETGASADDDGTGTTEGGDDDADDDDDDDGASGQSASAESEGGSEAADDAPATDDEGSFLLEPDGGVVNTCSPGEQDCPKGEKCTAYVVDPSSETVDGNKCVPVIGHKTFGEQCERTAENDDCDIGFFCMTDVSGHTGIGTCLEFCVENQPCEFGGMCNAFNDGVLPLCQTPCDPILQDCPADQGCYAAFEGFVCATPGAPEGLGNDGDSCATIQGCNPGLICSQETEGCATTQCCTSVCDLSEADTCTSPGEDCVPWLEDPPPQWQDVGACTVPA